MSRNTESSKPSSRERMFTNPDGSPSITAGSKCAFNNLIFAMEGNGWTPATKVLASTYFDLSEKEGFAFARRKYLRFRIKASVDTISTANRVIEASGLFSIKYRANNSLRVTPNLEAIEAAYQKYVADHADFKQQEDEWWNADAEHDEEGVDGNSDEVDGNPDEGRRKFRRGSSENPSRNPSRYSLHRNHPPKRSFSPPSAERGQTGSSSRKGRPSGGPAAGNDYLDQIDFSACVDELQKILPAYEPFGDYKPMDQKALDRSRRGAIREMEKLARLGWTLDEIRQCIDAYLRDYDEQAKSNFKRNGQCGRTLSGLLVSLVDQCDPETRNNADGEMYGWNIPDRFLRKPEQNQPQAASNDNRAKPERKVSGIDWENDPPF